ncbi:Na/Pi cotransporter family protein [Sinorhizobium sp. 8-89]|uniref:Na/Pi cotransporter family protein n=1 Tax=Sinorhizobium sp. 7-81 TaxID=3049087 RepID=UPI0024C2C882|nr:Na/Pi cotransporter family protein [Sinorhizobium sp. 7-81]MDK1389578.1 Na/Pi cotransporter family protein [Sinorhizobium sp. 7-81]
MTSGTSVIIELLGGVALLLWGVRMIRTGVMRGWGERLQRFVEQRLSNRLAAFGGGVVATAMLGSATAMALIIAGLAGSGAIGGTTGLAVLLGADVGSALVSGLFVSGSSLSMKLAPFCLFAGYVTFGLSSEFRLRSAGRIVLGLGMMLLALTMIVAATAPLRGATLFHEVLGAIAGEPILGFLVGAVLAWLCHSTLAVILLVSSLLINGSLEVAGAIPLILGINFGGGLPAVAATCEQPMPARRLPVANLFCRGFLALAGLLLGRTIVEIADTLSIEPLHIAVGLHAVFNVTVATVFLPFSPAVMRLCEKLMPDAAAADDPFAAPRYLDRLSLETPTIALSNAVTETVRMSEILERMFRLSLMALKSRRLEDLKDVAAIDVRLGNYLASVHVYLGQLPADRLTSSDSRRAFEVLHYASNLEHAGDVIKLSLANRIRATIKQDTRFSSSQTAALEALCEVISLSLRLVPAALTSRDVTAAARLAAQKDRFRELEDSIVNEHLGRDQVDSGADGRGNALFIDLVRDLHRINSHIAAAGYPLIQAAGLLNASRIRHVTEAR